MVAISEENDSGSPPVCCFLGWKDVLLDALDERR
jgi:hypothetical protein